MYQESLEHHQSGPTRQPCDQWTSSVEPAASPSPDRPASLIARKALKVVAVYCGSVLQTLKPK